MPPTPQNHSSENPYHLQHDREDRPTVNVNNQDEDHFNELLLPLFNVQEDLQKQSFNMIPEMAHRQEYDNLMRDILIYNCKNMDLDDLLLQIQ